jgi:hypothetical protein
LQDQLSAHRSQLDEKERQINELKQQVIEQLEDELAVIRLELQDRTAGLQSARSTIEQLENDLAERTAQLEQARTQERPFDLAEYNRPPPDVTQYQGIQLHPDVAHHSSVSVQPDLMPQYNFQGEEPEQVQFFHMPSDQQAADGGEGWNDAAWGDADDWFAGVQPGNQLEQHQQLPELFQQHQPQQFVADPLLQEAVPVQQQQEIPAAASHEDVYSLREQLQANEAELTSLRGSLADKAEECSRLENELSQLEIDSNHLKQLLNAKEDECSGLKSNLAELKADQDLAKSTYSEAMDSLRSKHHEEIDTLRSEAKRTNEDKEALEAELEISTQECTDLKENLAKVKIISVYHIYF